MTPSMRVGASPRAPDQTIVYAIGDVHGRLDLLQRLTEQLDVETAAAARDGKSTVAVFLGDYIDRGPDSAGVVAHLIAYRSQAACETIFLRGNHEDVLLNLLDGREDSARWLEYGGEQTLRSYGASFKSSNPNISAEKLRQSAMGAIPAEHIDFLRETELYVRLGDYIFVHAGLRPDRLVEEQTDADMMWFRYYDDEPPIWSGTVVHGHTVYARPIRGRARIGIDTGAYVSDALTALRLEGDRQEFIKVSLNPEDGGLDIDFWDSVDRAFAGAIGQDAGAERRRSPPRAKARPTPRPGVDKKRSAEVKPRPKPAGSGKGRPFPNPVLAAAGAALAVATVAAVVLYNHGLNPVVPRASSKPVAAESRVRPPLPAAGTAAPAAAPAPSPLAEASAVAAGEKEALTANEAGADLRPLNQAAASDPKLRPTPAEGAREASGAPGADGAVRVQIAATPSVDDARRAWSALAEQFPTDMSAKAFETEEVQVGERTLHRAMVSGFATSDDAQRFCGRLRQAGRSCILRPKS